MSQDPPPPPRPGNYDRAWNDPPLFSYSSTADKNTNIGETSSGLKLNKRVGFPTTTTKVTSSASNDDRAPSTQPHDAGARSLGGAMPPPPPSAGGLPPPPSAGGVLPPPPPSSSPASAPAEPGDAAATAPNVDDVLASLAASLEASSLDARKRQDVSKRIAMMETKWRAGSMNPPVQNAMGALAEHLAAGRTAEAAKIQVNLMVDWPAQCTQWMVGIKHLIQACGQE